MSLKYGIQAVEIHFPSPINPQQNFHANPNDQAYKNQVKHIYP